MAAALGDADGDGLMARCRRCRPHRSPGRATTPGGGSVLDLRGPPPRTALQTRSLAPGVVLRDGEVTLDAAAAAEDPLLALRVAALAAAGTAA